MSQTATFTDTGTVLTEQVQAAVKTFAEALAEMPEFQQFEEAAMAYRKDFDALQSVRLFQEKQRSLQMLQQLDLLKDDELAELKRMRQAMMDQPSVRAYVEAQDALMLLCQAATQELSQIIDLDFARACAPGCC